MTTRERIYTDYRQRIEAHQRGTLERDRITRQQFENRASEPLAINDETSTPPDVLESRRLARADDAARRAARLASFPQLTQEELAQRLREDEAARTRMSEALRESERVASDQDAATARAGAVERGREIERQREMVAAALDVDLLNVAAARGDIDTVRMLIRIGYPLDEQDSSGWTALDRATHSGNTAIAALLIRAGATNETTLPATDELQRVHVKGYYRKDGAYVAPYERRSPR